MNLENPNLENLNLENLNLENLAFEIQAFEVLTIIHMEALRDAWLVLVSRNSLIYMSSVVPLANEVSKTITIVLSHTLYFFLRLL